MLPVQAAEAELREGEAALPADALMLRVSFYEGQVTPPCPTRAARCIGATQRRIARLPARALRRIG